MSARTIFAKQFQPEEEETKKLIADSDYEENSNADSEYKENANVDSDQKKSIQAITSYSTVFATCKYYIHKYCYWILVILLICISVGFLIDKIVEKDRYVDSNTLEKILAAYNNHYMQILQEQEERFNKTLEHALLAAGNSASLPFNTSMWSSQWEQVQGVIRMEVGHVRNESSNYYASLVEQLMTSEMQTKLNISTLTTHSILTSDRLMNLSHQIDDLTLSRDNHVDLLGSVNSNITGLFNILSHMHSFIRALNSSQLSQDQQIMTLNSSMVTLEEAQSILSHQLSNLSGMLNNLEEQTTASVLYLGTEIAEQDKKLKNISEHANLLYMTLEEAQSILSHQLSNLSGRLNNLEEQMTASVLYLSTEIAEQDKKLKNISEHVKLLYMSRDELQSHLNQIDLRQSEIASKQEQIDHRLNRFNSSTQVHSQEIVALQANVSSLRTQLKDTERRFTEQKSALDQKNIRQDERLKSVESGNLYASDDRRSIKSRVSTLEQQCTSSAIIPSCCTHVTYFVVVVVLHKLLNLS